MSRAMENAPEHRFASAAEAAAPTGTPLAASLGPTGEDLASSEAFETGVTTEETPLVEQGRGRGLHALVGRLVAEAGPGWLAPLLGGAATIIGVLAVCGVLIAGPMTSSGERRGIANSGPTAPITTPSAPAPAPITTPPSTAEVTSPATTAEMTTPTTARVTPSQPAARVIASPTQLSS